MNEESNVPNRPSYLAHPAVLLVALGVGALDIWYFADGWNPDVRRSIVIGLALSLPLLLLAKWVLRRTVDYYAEWDITPLFEREQARNFLYCLPIFVYIVGFWVLLSALEVRSEAGFGVIGVLSVVLYPEQRTIYRAAWDKIEEMRAADTTKVNTADC